GGIEGLARGVGLMVDQPRRQALPAGPGQARRLGPAGDDGHDFGGIVGQARRPHQPPPVGATARHQDGPAPFRPHPPDPSCPEKRTASASALPLAGAVRPRPASTAPIKTGLSPAPVRAAITSPAAAGSATTTRPMPQLKVRSISPSSSWPAPLSQANT